MLSFYYPPDLSAGSFRAKALIEALLAQLPEDEEHHIDLMTTMPNRYSTFLNEAAAVENTSRLSVHRALLPHHKSGMLDQSWAFWAFARQTLAQVRKKQYDFVIATSSRLMTAALGSFIARREKIPLYLDIRDIYVDAIKDVLPTAASLIVSPFFSLVERFTMMRANKINLVSEGFKPYFLDRYPSQTYSFFPNGIDDDFLISQDFEKEITTEQQEFFSPRSFSLEKNVASLPCSVLQILYAGNIGEGQGLHVFLPDLAKKMEGRAQFRIIGDGGRRKALEENLKKKNCHNVQLIRPLQRRYLIEEYRAADILFLHLNAYDAFKKVLPSKIFEYAATGKPVLAGVAGYAAVFIKKEITNAAIFEPCDVEGAIEALNSLNLSSTDRSIFIDRFARRKIMNEMASDIIVVAKNITNTEDVRD